MSFESLLPARLEGRLRPLSGRDEELLATRRAGNAAATCNELLARCLSTANDEVASMLVHDRDLALVALRRLTYGDRLDVELACTTCEARHDVTIDLDRLVRPDEPPASVTVEMFGHRVVARLPTAGDQVHVVDAAGDKRAHLLGCVVRSIDDRSGPFTIDDVQALAPALRAELEQAIEAALPDIDLVLITTCPACEAAIEAPVQLAQIVLAELQERSRHLLREIHVIARAYHWSEREILDLAVSRRRAYLALIDADRDAVLYAEATDAS
jgi:hypothetical protein